MTIVNARMPTGKPTYNPKLDDVPLISRRKDKNYSELRQDYHTHSITYNTNINILQHLRGTGGNALLQENL